MNEELIKHLTELIKELTTTLKLLNQPQYVISSDQTSCMCTCPNNKACDNENCPRVFKEIK
jgi:hypothetical protein